MLCKTQPNLIYRKHGLVRREYSRCSDAMQEALARVRREGRKLHTPADPLLPARKRQKLGGPSTETKSPGVTQSERPKPNKDVKSGSMQSPKFHQPPVNRNPKNTAPIQIGNLITDRGDYSPATLGTSQTFQMENNTPSTPIFRLPSLSMLPPVWKPNQQTLDQESLLPGHNAQQVQCNDRDFSQKSNVEAGMSLDRTSQHWKPEYNTLQSGLINSSSAVPIYNSTSLDVTDRALDNTLQLQGPCVENLLLENQAFHNIESGHNQIDMSSQSLYDIEPDYTQIDFSSRDSHACWPAASPSFIGWENNVAPQNAQQAAITMQGDRSLQYLNDPIPPQDPSSHFSGLQDLHSMEWNHFPHPPLPDIHSDSHCVTPIKTSEQLLFNPLHSVEPSGNQIFMRAVTDTTSIWETDTNLQPEQADMSKDSEMHCEVDPDMSQPSKREALTMASRESNTSRSEATVIPNDLQNMDSAPLSESISAAFSPDLSDGIPHVDSKTGKAMANEAAKDLSPDLQNSLEEKFANTESQKQVTEANAGTKGRLDLEWLRAEDQDKVREHLMSIQGECYPYQFSRHLFNDSWAFGKKIAKGAIESVPRPVRIYSTSHVTPQKLDCLAMQSAEPHYYLLIVLRCHWHELPDNSSSACKTDINLPQFPVEDTFSLERPEMIAIGIGMLIDDMADE